MEGTRFRTTRWSLVLEAGAGGRGARLALDALYRAYFHPLRSLVAKQRGHEDARELTHAFFVSRLVQRGDLKHVQRAHGRRFRGWLCTALQSFLKNQWHFERRKRRDARRTLLLGDAGEDTVARLRHGERDPEQQLSRAEVLALLGRVLERLRDEYRAHASRAGVNAEQRFDAVKRFLQVPGTEDSDYAECARELGVTPATVRQLVCQLRKRMGQLLHEEIRGSVDSDEEVAAAKASMRAALEPPPAAPGV
jgi:DNA-directed RNA polymerase specialized sigma24 family protein